MKLLAVSDLHGDFTQLMGYLENNRVDLIIISGDITQFGPVELAEEILNEISSFDVPVLTIPGNCDPESIHGAIENSRAINIHGRSMVIKDIGICGFGGSNPTPFDTPLEFEEVQIYEQVSKVMEGLSKENVTILVTHAPPYGTKTDVLPSGEHAGSTSIRKVIEEYQPTLNLCGHIHESMGVDHVGNTTVANPGALNLGHGCLIHLGDGEDDDTIMVEIIEL